MLRAVGDKEANHEVKMNPLLTTGLVPSSKNNRPLRNVSILWISDPDGFEFHHNLNLYGFRGKNFKIGKNANKNRVVFIGDSLVEGFGTDDNSTIPRQFEQIMQKGDIEAINLGVGATGLSEYVVLAKAAVRLLEPGFLTVVIYDNDIPAIRGPYFDFENEFNPVRNRWWESRIWYVVREIINGNTLALFYYRGPFPFFAAIPHQTNPLSSSPGPGRTNPKIYKAMQAGRFNPFLKDAARNNELKLCVPLDVHCEATHYINRLAALSRSNSVPLLIVYIPLSVTVSDYYYRLWNQLGERFTVDSLTTPQYRKPQEYLKQLCKSLDIRFVDTTPVIEKHEQRGEHLYHGYDDHMNSKGYRIVAEEIYRAYSE
jgi:lysophospholipase L1-like esterase